MNLFSSARLPLFKAQTSDLVPLEGGAGELGGTFLENYCINAREK